MAVIRSSVPGVVHVEVDAAGHSGCCGGDPEANKVHEPRDRALPRDPQVAADRLQCDACGTLLGEQLRAACGMAGLRPDRPLQSGRGGAHRLQLGERPLRGRQQLRSLHLRRAAVRRVAAQRFRRPVSVSDTGKISPALAIAWQRLDDVRFRLSLRRGVTFQNGEAFDAEAVRFSLMRASRRTARLPGFPRLPASISSIRTSSMSCSRPRTVCSCTASGTSLRCCRRNISGRSAGAVRCTAGRYGRVPIRHAGIRPGERCCWRPIGSTGGGGTPKSRGWSTNTSVRRRRSRAWALAASISCAASIRARRRSSWKTGSGKIVKAWLPQLVLGPFNLLKPHTPLKDLRVRKAINLAIDREDVLALRRGREWTVDRRLSVPEESGPCRPGAVSVRPV